MPILAPISFPVLVSILVSILAATLPVPAEAAPSRATGEWSVEARDLLIESLTVEGAKRVSPELIVGESLLRDGRSYSEGELQAAVRRIRRLPFVLDARLSLRKGSRRGAYELVIAVVESRRFFFGANLRLATFASPLALADQIRPAPARTLENSGELDLTAGARWFTGAHGVVFAGVDTEGVRAGVLHYDLFGRNLFGSLQVAVGDTCCVQRVFPLGLDPALGRWSLRDTRQVGIEVGLPTSAERSIRIRLHTLDGDESSRSEILGGAGAGAPRDALPDASRIFLGDGFEHWRLRAAWIHDSSDDPVLPTRGTVISAGVTAETLDSRQTVTTFQGGRPVTEALPAYEARYVALEALATRHLGVAYRQTVSVSGSASLGRSKVENLLAGGELLAERGFTSYSASVAVRWSLDLRKPQGLASTPGDLRFEAGVGYGWEGTTPNLQLAGNPLESLDLQVALVLRNGWGVFRLGLTYLDAGEVLR